MGRCDLFLHPDVCLQGLHLMFVSAGRASRRGSISLFGFMMRAAEEQCEGEGFTSCRGHMTHLPPPKSGFSKSALYCPEKEKSN